MTRRKFLANLIATAHIIWVLGVTTVSVASFFIPGAKIFAIMLLLAMILSQKIFYGCPLTIWENRVRFAIDKSFNMGETFVYRLVGVKISRKTQERLPIIAFVLVLFFSSL